MQIHTGPQQQQQQQIINQRGHEIEISNNDSRLPLCSKPPPMCFFSQNQPKSIPTWTRTRDPKEETQPKKEKEKKNPSNLQIKSRFESYSKYLVVLYSFLGLLLLLP
jgi:hypothetical protein